MEKLSPGKRKFLGEGMILLECLLWGIGNPISKIGMEHIPAFWCIGLRFLLAFVLFIIFFRKRIFTALPGVDWKNCILISIFNGLAFIFGNLSLLYTTATISSFLMSLSVIFTPFVSMILLKKRSNFKTYFCILIVIAGLYFLCGNEGSFSFGIGELLAILCSASLGICLTLTSKYIADTDPIVLAALQSAVAAVMAIIGAFIFNGPLSLSSVDSVGIFAIVYLALACTVAAYILQNVAMRYMSAVFASVVFCTEPVFTAAAAYFMLDERLSITGFAGGFLILLGVVAASLFQLEKPKKEI